MNNIKTVTHITIASLFVILAFVFLDRKFENKDADPLPFTSTVTEQIVDNQLQTPDVIYGKLFEEVQLSGLFEDSKTFVDMTPTMAPKDILKAYEAAAPQGKEELLKFVETHFEYARISSSEPFVSDTSMQLEDHISRLWPYLTRTKDEDLEGSSLIPLPYPYIVPGGRFKEIYYWDSYFTMLGLAIDDKEEIIENMVLNFAYLIDKVGHIPNGNRSYFVSRSQPPFFALMVDLHAQIEGEEVLRTFLPSLQKEYDFWMDPRGGRVVNTPFGRLNRYWDNNKAPREESYKEDVELAEVSEHIYTDLRAACESGWDFSSRWFADQQNLRTICTSEIIPVDLNCLLYFLETTLAKGYELKGSSELAQDYNERANRRKSAIHQLFLHPSGTYYADYWQKTGKVSDDPTLAMMYPLFIKVADQATADATAQLLEEKFLKPGGLVTTLHATGQQWDAPNGWAPLQWVAVSGLNAYGHEDLAKKIASRWTNLNERVFKNTGKMLEKYNVVDNSLFAGGGEYPVQDGFGWTNGVYLALEAFLDGKIIHSLESQTPSPTQVKTE